MVINAVKRWNRARKAKHLTHNNKEVVGHSVFRCIEQVSHREMKEK